MDYLIFRLVLLFTTIYYPNRCHARNTNLVDLEEWWTKFSTSYPKYEETTSIFLSMQTSYPDLVKVYSIGKSVQGREMWVINLRHNVRENRRLLQPQVKIVANIHGDETVGRALVLMFAVDLVRSYMNDDSRVVKLLGETDIHLLPSMNPDGFEALGEVANCSPDPTVIGRLNANLVDLNTNFLPNPLKVTRQPETENVIKWLRENHFILSASLFSEQLLVTYPFNHNEKGKNALTPENDLFIHLAHLYSRSHGTMTKFNSSCEIDGNDRDAVMNGASWRKQSHTMQDYTYIHSKCLEISVYLSCCKYPDASSLLVEWDNNRESLYKFIEASHMGFKGTIWVPWERKNSPRNMTMKVVTKLANSGRESSSRVTDSYPHEYWTLALPGTYNVKGEVITSGRTNKDFEGESKVITVENDSTVSTVDLSIWSRSTDMEDEKVRKRQSEVREGLLMVFGLFLLVLFILCCLNFRVFEDY